MVTAKSNPNGGGVRKGRACSKSTGNPLEDMQNAKAMQGPSAGATPSRARVAAAQPIAIPENSTGARRRNGSPRSVQSASPRSTSSYTSSTKSSPLRASPSTNGLFYAGAKFSEAPAATSLPKPPSHWTSTIIQHHHHHQQKDQFQEISNQLKMLLNIKAWECTKSSCSYGTLTIKLCHLLPLVYPIMAWKQKQLTIWFLHLHLLTTTSLQNNRTSKNSAFAERPWMVFWIGFWNNGWRFKI